MTCWPDRHALRPMLVLLAATAVARAEDTFFSKRVAPILEEKCVLCHGEKKQKGKLRLDSYEWLVKGGEGGAAITPGDPKDSELYIRVTLPAEDEDFMPADNKPALTKDEVKVIEAWIKSGASNTSPVTSISGAPAAPKPKAPVVPLAPDWRPRAAQLAQLEQALGLRLTPRSTVATDGLVLRTASAPSRCDDAALARLAPVADLVVEAELARTKVTDAGLASLATYTNLRSVDLTRTAITSAGLAKLTALKDLESLNLTSTPIDEAGVAPLRTLPKLKKIWLFDTKAAPAEESAAPEAAK